ncbi:hypothetical protein TNCV_1647101 [Trichonephila clavipes]|nr:hypothetical protein TNCV_1647101 [Trichonephila clavipes]
MVCDAEDCVFQILNDDEIVSSLQEESNPVDDETDEDEDNSNNESSKCSLNADAFSALETAMGNQMSTDVPRLLTQSSTKTSDQQFEERQVESSS